MRDEEERYITEIKLDGNWYHYLSYFLEQVEIFIAFY